MSTDYVNSAQKNSLMKKKSSYLLFVEVGSGTDSLLCLYQSMLQVETCFSPQVLIFKYQEEQMPFPYNVGSDGHESILILAL